jgi:tetratricopeptide (TPR) repeat protein
MRLTSLAVLFFAASLTVNSVAADYAVGDSFADMWYLKASLSIMDGELEDGARMLETVLESVEDEHIYIKLAAVYGQLNDREMQKFTLERGVRGLPDSYILLGSLADFYRSDEDTVSRSFELYQKAYKMSGNPAYAEAEAIAHAALKDYNSAIKIYDSLIKKGAFSDYYVQRGRLYEKLGLAAESIADYITAADMDENYFAAAKLADHYAAAGDTENAVRYLKMVVKVSPELTLAQFRLAELLDRMGRQDEASDYYHQILNTVNEEEKVYVLKRLAAIAYSRQDYAKAEGYFRSAYSMDEDIQTAYSLALLAETTGKTDEAAVWYQTILKKRPDFVEAAKRLAILHLRNKEPLKSLEILNSVADIYQDVDYYRIKGQAYVDSGDLRSAVEILDIAVTQNPAEVKLYLDLALAQDKKKDKIAAETTVKKGLKLFPDDPSLLNFLGYMYAEQGINLSKAEKMIKKALEKEPDEPAYLDSMAWVLYQQGQYAKALPFQKKALKKSPDEQELRDHMEAILKKLGIAKTIEEIISED